MSNGSRCFKLLVRYSVAINLSTATSLNIGSSSASFRCQIGEISHFRYNNCALSSTFLASVNRILGNYQFFSTLVSSDGEQVSDETLTQILASVENDPKSKEICTTYVDKLCRAGNLSVADRFLQSLRDKSIFLPNAYYSLLAAAAEKYDIGISCQVFKDLLVSQRVLSSSCYLNIARAFLGTNNSDELLRFVEQVLRIAFPESIVVVNRIIFAFAECRQIEKALLIFYYIRGSKHVPDLVTYNTVLDILGNAGRVTEMLNEFAFMEEVGIAPDFISYNTLLNNLRKGGRLDLCLVYFKRMLNSGIKPDLLTYTALIESFGRSGNVDEALRLFNDMKQKQIRPSIYVYRSLINNLKKMGKLDSAMRLAKELDSSSVTELAGQKDFKRKCR